MEKERTKRPMTTAQMKDITALLMESIPMGMLFDDAEYCIGNKKKMQWLIQEVLLRGKVPERDAFIEWKQVYSAIAGCSFSSLDGLRLRVRPEGFERLIIVHQAMTMAAINMLYTKEGIGLKFRNIDQLDLQRAGHRRYKEHMGRAPYAIWTKDMDRPDMVNMSANDLVQLEIAYMNLPEFLLMFWKHWQETRLPFDGGMATLLPDTWFHDGTIPCAQWTGTCIEVSKVSRETNGPTYGARHICAI